MHKTRILFYGDSNTYGFDPRGPFGGRYPSSVRWTGILQKELGDRFDFVFEGMNGRSLPVSRPEYEWLEDLVRSEAPIDYFAVMLGTNDILLTRRPDASLAAAGMDRLLEKLLEWLPEASAVLLLIPPLIAQEAVSSVPFYIDGVTLPADEFRRYYDESVRLAELYRRLSEKYAPRIICIDTSAWKPALSYDQIHLSEEGHRTFAAEIIKVLKLLPSPAG